MRRPSRTGLSCLFVLCANAAVIAQNLESIGKEKPFGFSAGFSLNQIFYASSSAAAREPYSYFASGNVNLSLYGWSVPLTFAVSNHQTTFSQPFNQYSLHPSWKWITLHAGYTSMSFSPYTVNGHIFNGAGLDLEGDGKWKLSSFYGRFLKAVEADSNSTQPSYQRMGFGVKASFSEGRNFVDVTLFRAEDNKNSIRPPADSLNITPHENLVVSLATGKSLLKYFLLKAEIAASALTRDVRAEKAEHNHPLASSPILFQPKASSVYYKAFKCALDYQQDSWMVGIGYERIDPGYRTLGAYYFNSDLENVTLNGSGGTLNGKISVAASGGVQRDNVDNTKMSTMRRMVGSLNVNYTPSQRFNITVSWSSFQTYTNIRPQFETLNQLTPYDHLDTLNFTQVSKNASVSAMYLIGHDESTRKNLHLNVSWQAASDNQGDVQQYAGTTFCNVNAGYAMSLARHNSNLSVTWNTTFSNGPAISTRTFGPAASLARSFLDKKLRASLSSSYNQTYSNAVKVNRILNGRINAQLTVQNKHKLNVNTVVVNRTTGEGKPHIMEFTATLGYNYSFGGQGR